MHNNCGQTEEKGLLQRLYRLAVTPLEDFIHQETASGVVLMACALLAILVANSPLSPWYERLLHTSISLAIGPFSLQYSLHHWINDGLMALFFFVVGLEIKREILIGELAALRQAVLPISCAIGGMLVPAALYALINPEGIAARGWGIPMATDIAFALGVMALLGSRVPKALISLLLAVAIVDDLGAVLVIALFYTENLSLAALSWALFFLLLLLMMNRIGIRSSLPYLLLGLLLWLAMLQSGVHATLAGVLTALTVPARSSCAADVFSSSMCRMAEEFRALTTRQQGDQAFTVLQNSRQQGILQGMEYCVRTMESPLQRMEHGLHLWVSFGIVPLFALANAGVVLELSQLSTALTETVTIGVILGLVAGKLVGILLAAWLVLRLGMAVLPVGIGFAHLTGMALLAGIGFTMSIFIGSLAFPGTPQLLHHAKIGIVFASLFSGVAGYCWLRWTAPPQD